MGPVWAKALNPEPPAPGRVMLCAWSPARFSVYLGLFSAVWNQEWSREAKT